MGTLLFFSHIHNKHHLHTSPLQHLWQATKAAIAICKQSMQTVRRQHWHSVVGTLLSSGRGWRHPHVQWHTLSGGPSTGGKCQGKIVVTVRWLDQRANISFIIRLSYAARASVKRCHWSNDKRIATEYQSKSLQRYLWRLLQLMYCSLKLFEPKWIRIHRLLGVNLETLQSKTRFCEKARLFQVH